MQRALFDSERDRRASTEQMAELAEQLGRLNDTQTELRSALRALAQSGSGQQGLSEDLRQEFRLLSRTIAAAVEHKRD
jgi:septal ring factor EnvC (AmiA/AmiB activator)